MGGHYGSIQVRSADRDAVKAVAKQVAESLKIRLLMSPVIDGWIGLYPENSGQDEKVGKAVAGSIDGYVIHLLVHDDDIFAYWLFHDRQLIDSYWSSPGYFSEGNRAAEEKRIGNPEIFRPLIQERVKRLATLLRRDEGKLALESKRLAAFAKLLEISNAVQAYEYLKESDRGRVKGWRQFEEIPSTRMESEKTNARSKKARIKAAIEQYRTEGLLFLREERKGKIAYGCCCGDGFLVAWPDHFKHTVEFSISQPPWMSHQALLLETPVHVTAVASDVGAQRIAISAGDRVQIWDLLLDQPRLLTEVPETDLSIGVAISNDGRRVFHVSRQEMVLSDATDGSRLFSMPTNSCRNAAFHPSGEWLVMSGNSLGLISLSTEPSWRVLLMGTQPALAAGMQRLVLSMLKKGAWKDLETYEDFAIQKCEQTLRKRSDVSTDAKVHEAALAKGRENVRQFVRDVREIQAAYAEGRPLPSRLRQNEPVSSARFSRDGRWLFCSTNSGLAIYEWSSVPRTSGSIMPSPVWSFDITAEGPNSGSHPIHAMIDERDASALIFACDNKINRMDLSSGQTHEILRLQEDVSVYELLISLDGTGLGIASRPLRTQNTLKQKCYWEVWSLARLRGAM